MAFRQPYVSDEIERIGSLLNNNLHEKPSKTDITKIEIVQKLAKTIGEDQTQVAPLADIDHVMHKVDSLTVDDCRAHIEQILKDHEYDYNFSAAQRQKLEGFLIGPLEHETIDDWELRIKVETAVNKFFSLYPEVRAVTTPHDDPSIACETLRAHLLGYLWVIVAQFINSFFNSRFPSISLQSSVAQVLLYPCGKVLAWILPDWGFDFGGRRHSLNPGAWTYKEQMLSTLIVNVGSESAYVFWNIQTQEIYYRDTWLTPAYKILLLLSTQLMGLGFAGLLRRFVVYPAQAIWPSILPTLALNRALLVPEPKAKVNGWSMSRYTFFFFCFAAMFAYFWVPSVLFSGLSYFAWMTWIAKDNFHLALITGSQTGLGFNPVSSFDWNIFATYYYPLAWPVFSYVQQYVGQIIGGLVILAIYYTNTKWTSYLPPNTSGIFDNTGAHYNTTRVVKNGTLDEAAYQAYSPAFYGAGNLVLYGAYFAFYTFTFVFIILDSWRPISKAYRQLCVAAYKQTKHTISCLKLATTSLVTGKLKESIKHLYRILDDTTSVYDGFDDPFTNMMRKYPEVPDWWFFSIVLISFIFAIILLTQYPQLNTPIWTIFFVIGLNLAFLIPLSYLNALAGTTRGLNVLTELIIGYAIPGRPEALMFAKAYGCKINGQADTYTADQKMGLYAKIPPRAMFRGQMMGSVIAAFVAYGAVTFVDNKIEGICTSTQAHKFTCASGSQVYFSASVIWGAIGPARIFGQIYPALKWCFLLGFLLAIVWWAIKSIGPCTRHWCRSHLSANLFSFFDMIFFGPIAGLRDVHPSLVINGMIYWAPLNLTYATTGLYFSIGFMYFLRKYRTAWWERYNYVLAAAFDGGVAFSGLILFFTMQYHEKYLDWWGNRIVGEGIDGGAGRRALLTELPERGFFGPDTWY